MSRRSDSPAHVGAVRVAVVGSGSPEGAHLRAELAAQGVPGARVDLFGITRGEAVLGEYGGEARLIQDPEPELVADHDVVFLCERGDSSQRVLHAARSEQLVIDLVGCEGSAALVHSEIRPGDDGSRRVAVPHGLSVVLAELLHPLERSFGIRDATAVVLRPASDFGEPGVDELREQTIRILRFEAPETATFGRQLAFNVIPERLVAPDDDLCGRVASEVAKLLGWEENRLAVRTVLVPVFFGHGISARLAFTKPAGPEVIAETLAFARDVSCATGGDAGTPMESNEARETVVSEISEDGVNGTWIWAVAGEVGVAAAQQAVRIARNLAGL